MLKIRMQGMTSDIEWFQKILEEDKRIRVLGISEPFANKGTNKYFRVYAEVNISRPEVQFSLKNISAQPLNISADELTERFIRGDVARNTEGSGLGLSIAKSLTELQGGEFKLYLDGDLFKVMITFVAKNYSK